MEACREWIHRKRVRKESTILHRNSRGSGGVEEPARLLFDMQKHMSSLAAPEDRCGAPVVPLEAHASLFSLISASQRMLKREHCQSIFLPEPVPVTCYKQGRVSDHCSHFSKIHKDKTA